MRLKFWASNLTLAVVAVVAVGIVTGAHVRTQAPFLVFGSSSGSSQVVKSTSNALWISLQGGSATTIPFTINGPALTTTSTDGLVIQNATASTVGVPVQMSPRAKWCGSAWNSVGAASETDCFIAEVLPATVAGTTTEMFKLRSTINGGAPFDALTLTDTGALSIPGTFATTGGNISATNGSLTVAAAGQLAFATRAMFKSSADKLIQALDVGVTTGLELNLGTPTLGTCTGGSMVSGSHNGAGEVTGNTSGSCVINFGTPNFTNTPFCFVNDETALIAVRISARSASSITVTGAGSGDAFQFFCIGRIGT